MYSPMSIVYRLRGRALCALLLLAIPAFARTRLSDISRRVLDWFDRYARAPRAATQE